MKEKRNRRKTVMAVLSAVSLAMAVSGCGGRAASDDTAANSSGKGEVSQGVSGSAVSGGAAPAADHAGSDDEASPAGQYRYHTDTNAYYLDTGDICQIRLDGTHKKKILSVGTRCNGQQICGVQDGWLYFQKETPGALYRVPIIKDTKGYDVVKKSGEKRVSELDNDSVTVLYMDLDYVFYKDETEQTLFQYDWNRKKQSSAWEPDDFDYVKVTKLGGQYVVLNEDAGVFAREESQEWKKISGEDTVATDVQLLKILYVQDDKQLFYVPCVPEGDVRDGDNIGASVRVYDGIKEKSFVSEEQIVQAVRQSGTAGEGKVTCCSISNLFMQNHRLYIQVQAEWMQGERYYVQYVLVSQDVENGGLQYEKTLSECMHSQTKCREGSVRGENGKIAIGHITANDAQCIGMADGRAYISCYDYEGNKGRLGCYVLADGKFSWLDGEDADYRKLCATAGEDIYDMLNNSVFYEESANPFCGFHVFGIEGADEYEFHEKEE